MGLMMTFAPTLAPEHHCLWLKIPLLIDTNIQPDTVPSLKQAFKSCLFVKHSSDGRHSDKCIQDPTSDLQFWKTSLQAIANLIQIWAGCTKRSRIGFWERKCARYLVKNPKLFNKNDEWLFSVDIFSQITSEFDGMKISDDEISTSFSLDQVFQHVRVAVDMSYLSYYSQVAR